MDQDEVLEEMRSAVKATRSVQDLHLTDRQHDLLMSANAAFLADVFEKLDKHITEGGVLPRDWAAAPRC